MRELVANKPFRYRRSLQDGDYFTAESDADARVLVTIGSARYAVGQVKSPAPQQSAVSDENLPALRAQYESAFGKRPFMGWDADKLREKLAEGPKD